MRKRCCKKDIIQATVYVRATERVSKHEPSSTPTTFRAEAVRVIKFPPPVLDRAVGYRQLGNGTLAGGAGDCHDSDIDSYPQVTLTPASFCQCLVTIKSFRSKMLLRVPSIPQFCPLRLLCRADGGSSVLVVTHLSPSISSSQCELTN